MKPEFNRQGAEDAKFETSNIQHTTPNAEVEADGAARARIPNWSVMNHNYVNNKFFSGGLSLEFSLGRYEYGDWWWVMPAR